MTYTSMRFSGATIANINIYRTSPTTESFIKGINAKLTPSQVESVRKICNEHNLDMSTLARDALSFYIDLFPYKEKCLRHHRLLRQILDGLS